MFNVSGAKATPTPTITKVRQEEAIIIPDKQTYSPFDGETTGELLIQSPFKPAEGLLTLLCEGVVHTERFKLVEDAATVKFPIKEDWQPNVQIQVDLMGCKPRALNSGALDLTAPPRPCFAKGLANINIVNKSDALKVNVSPSQTSYKPGAQAVVNVHVTNAKNEPQSEAEGDYTAIPNRHIVDLILFLQFAWLLSTRVSWHWQVIRWAIHCRCLILNVKRAPVSRTWEVQFYLLGKQSKAAYAM